jgi:tol-pal system protein YbgF
MPKREREGPIGADRSGRASRRMRAPEPRRKAAFRTAGVVATALFAGGVLGGCATKGELLALEERVIDAERRSTQTPEASKQIAELSAELDAMRTEMRELRGQVEVAEKKAEDALADARRARSSLAAAPTVATSEPAGGEVAVAGGVATVDATGEPPGDDDPAASAEVIAYREALNAWRANEHDQCIDAFRKFLQSYPSSAYADDGAYWMADCHFKKGEYRQAVLRFNDVVRVYPNGNKAPDALYRQGESLLKLGPGFYDAAKTVFQQVLNDYPDSDRAKQARDQLEAIGTG